MWQWVGAAVTLGFCGRWQPFSLFLLLSRVFGWVYESSREENDPSANDTTLRHCHSLHMAMSCIPQECLLAAFRMTFYLAFRERSWWQVVCLWDTPYNINDWASSQVTKEAALDTLKRAKYEPHWLKFPSSVLPNKESVRRSNQMFWKYDMDFRSHIDPFLFVLLSDLKKTLLTFIFFQGESSKMVCLWVLFCSWWLCVIMAFNSCKRYLTSVAANQTAIRQIIGDTRDARL